jgi:predicted acetyltransferase
MSIYLARPNKDFEESFKDYALAYKGTDETSYYNKYKRALYDFDGYLKELYDYSIGENLPEGYVKHLNFWLIDDLTVVGVVRVRYEEMFCAGHIGYDISPDHRNMGYGTRILELALEKAKEIGLKEAVVTCLTSNTSSRKIIEKNKGKLIGIAKDEDDGVIEEYYKFTIKLI